MKLICINKKGWKDAHTGEDVINCPKYLERVTLKASDGYLISLVEYPTNEIGGNWWWDRIGFVDPESIDWAEDVVSILEQKFNRKYTLGEVADFLGEQIKQINKLRKSL